MNLFHNRPLSCICCTFIGFALFSLLLSAKAVIVLSLLLAASLIGFILLWIKNRSLRVLLCFLCIAGALLSVLYSLFVFRAKLERYDAYVGEEVSVEGTVLKRRDVGGYGTVFTVQAEKVNGKVCRTDVQVDCTYASAMQPGERIRVRGTGKAFEEGDSAGSYLIGNGICFVVECTDYRSCEVLPAGRKSVRSLLAEWNEAASFRLERAVGGGREGALASALFLGNRDRLNAYDTLCFERAGISHVLALSGLHISILILFVDRLLRRLCCPKTARVIVILALAFFYLLFTGGAFSTARAVGMLAFVSVAYCIRADYDAFTGLCVILTTLLVLTPHAVMNTGMWMSFIAAGSIVIFYPAFAAWEKKRRQSTRMPRLLHKSIFAVLGALFVGTVANLSLFLLQALLFGQISALSVFSTVLLSLPLTLLLIFCIFTVIFPPAGSVCRFFASIMLGTAERISDAENILLPVNDPLTITVTGILTASLIFLAVAKLKRPTWCLLPIALALVTVITSVLVTQLGTKTLQMDYINTVSGETLVFSKKGSAIAIDFSEGSSANAAGVIECLAEARCTELDALVLSHYHDRTVYFLTTLANDVKIQTICLPTPRNDFERGVLIRMREEAEERSIDIHFDGDIPAPDGLEIRELSHFAFESERHPALLFSAAVGERKIAYVNGAVIDTPFSKTATSCIQNADILIVGKTGFSTLDTETLPQPSRQAESILLSDERVRRAFLYILPTTRVYSGENRLSYALE